MHIDWLEAVLMTAGIASLSLSVAVLAVLVCGLCGAG